MENPLCPLCGINPLFLEYDPDSIYPPSYDTYCMRCTGLMRSGPHNHTHYPSPVQVAAGTFKAGHSWRTASQTYPLWEDGKHVGYTCADYEPCGWVGRFTPAELQPCTLPAHKGKIFGVCRDYREHRKHRGECDGRGWITEAGREAERDRSDAANWDPGRYIEPEWRKR